MVKWAHPWEELHGLNSSLLAVVTHFAMASDDLPLCLHPAMGLALSNGMLAEGLTDAWQSTYEFPLAFLLLPFVTPVTTCPG